MIVLPRMIAQSLAAKNRCRGNRWEIVNMASAFLCCVCDKWAEELLQLLAAAGGACHFPGLMLLQCHHDQRLLSAGEALIVVHRHGALPSGNQPKIMSG